MTEPLITGFDTLLLDLDGVLYLGPEPIPYASESLNKVSDRGVRLCYVTNNASRPAAEVSAQLTSMGLHPDESDVITSAQAGAKLLAGQIAAQSRVLAVGGAGVREALTAEGLVPVNAQEGLMPAEGDNVVAVLQGFGRDVCWQALARASHAITSEKAVWVATNDDQTVPTEFGVAPGNGTLVDAVAAATGQTPEVVGKPYPPLYQEAARRTGGLKPLVVGDRLSTDIQGAANAKMESMLVLTGISGAVDLWRATTDYRPDFLGDDLRALLAPPLRVRADGDRVHCGDAVASWDGPFLSCELGATPAEGIWACAHLIWEAKKFPDNAPEIAARITGD